MKLIILTAMMVLMFGCSKDEVGCSKDEEESPTRSQYYEDSRGFVYNGYGEAFFTQEDGDQSRDIYIKSTLDKCETSVSLIEETRIVRDFKKVASTKAPKYKISFLGTVPEELEEEEYLYKDLKTKETFKATVTVNVICDFSYKDRVFARRYDYRTRYYTKDGFEIDDLPGANDEYGKKKIKTTKVRLNLEQYYLRLE